MLNYKDKMFESDDGSTFIQSKYEVNERAVTELDSLALEIVDGDAEVLQIEMESHQPNTFRNLVEGREIKHTLEVTYVEG